MQQGSFHEVPWRYLFREEEAGTRRAGRRECSTTAKGACLGDRGKVAKNQRCLIQTLATYGPELRPSSNFTTDHLLKTRAAFCETALTTYLQEAIRQL